MEEKEKQEHEGEEEKERQKTSQLTWKINFCLFLCFLSLSKILRNKHPPLSTGWALL